MKCVDVDIPDTHMDAALRHVVDEAETINEQVYLWSGAAEKSGTVGCGAQMDHKTKKAGGANGEADEAESAERRERQKIINAIKEEK
ncbi:hypothetical protein U1Q18_048470 [Sarracenia purpurea var. burkii]